MIFGCGFYSVKSIGSKAAWRTLRTALSNSFSRRFFAVCFFSSWNFRSFSAGVLFYAEKEALPGESLLFITGIRLFSNHAAVCAQQELSDIAAKKKDAISSFENVTRNIIADEIEGNHRAEIEEKEQKLQEVNDSLAQLESSIRQQNIHITDTFGPYLGKEYLNTDKLLGLSKLIQSGTASNITEAIEMDKNGVGKTETN